MSGLKRKVDAVIGPVQVALISAEARTAQRSFARCPG